MRASECRVATEQVDLTGANQHPQRTSSSPLFAMPGSIRTPMFNSEQRHSPGSATTGPPFSSTAAAHWWPSGLNVRRTRPLHINWRQPKGDRSPCADSRSLFVVFSRRSAAAGIAVTRQHVEGRRDRTGRRDSDALERDLAAFEARLCAANSIAHSPLLRRLSYGLDYVTRPI